MSSLNLTVDDFDPLVSYSDYDSWQTPNPQDHPDWYNQTEEVTNMPWHQATYHYTTMDGAEASFNFTGKAVSIYGAVGPAESNYTVTIDASSSNPITSTQQTANATEGRTLLYTTDELEFGQHQLTITNHGSGLLLDVFEVPVDIGADGATVTNTTLDDRAPELQFSGDWTQQNGDNFFNQTSTYTGGPGNALELNFTGSAVYVWGDQVNDHGEYTVSINGSSYGTYTGRSGCGGGYAKFCEKLHGLAFFAGYLPEGSHTLRIENLGPSEGNKTFFDFDYLVYSTPSQYAAQSVDAGNTTDTGTSSTTSPSSTATDSSGAAPLDMGTGALAFVLGAWALRKLM